MQKVLLITVDGLNLFNLEKLGIGFFTGKNLGGGD